MALLTPDVLQALKTAIYGNFQKGLTGAPSTFREVATVIPSSTASNTYKWLGGFPSLQKWAGKRVIKDMKAHSYQIENLLFESTVGIARTDVEDDNIGVLQPMAENEGYAAAIWYDELTYPLLPTGMSNLCYDGQNFFDTDHPVYANVDGTGAVSTVSNFFTPSSGGTESPAPWYIMDNSRPIKGLIFQERFKPNMTSLTDEENEVVFMDDQYVFGIRARGNAGYGLWQLAACSTLPLTPENFRLVYDAMRKVKTDGNRPLGIKPTHIVVPTELEGLAEEIILSDKINGSTNINKNKVKIHSSPWLD